METTIKTYSWKYFVILKCFVLKWGIMGIQLLTFSCKETGVDKTGIGTVT